MTFHVLTLSMQRFRELKRHPFFTYGMLTLEGKIKEQIEVTRRRGRRCKKLLVDLKDRRGYCQLKEDALDRTVWRNRFGRGFGPVV